MESDNIEADVPDIPTMVVNILRDRDINSDTSDLGKSSPKHGANSSACPVDEQVAESETESDVVGSDGGVQLDNGLSISDTIALLSDAVQTKLSFKDDQESVKGADEFKDTLVGNNINDENVTKSDNNDMPLENSLPKSLASANSDDNTGEPFPDYYESCENNPQFIDKEREEAYNYAISKVIEEVVRFREVGPSITDLSSPNSQIISTSVNSNHSASSSEGDNPTEAWKPASRSEIHKVTAFNEMTRILARPDMKPNLRKRFMGITNMVIRMEYLLFNKYRPMVDGLVVSDRDLWELNIMAMESVKYLSSLDNKLRVLIDDTYRVQCCLNALNKEEDVSLETRYQRMAQVVIQ